MPRSLSNETTSIRYPSRMVALWTVTAGGAPPGCTPTNASSRTAAASWAASRGWRGAMRSAARRRFNVNTVSPPSESATWPVGVTSRLSGEGSFMTGSSAQPGPFFSHLSNQA